MQILRFIAPFQRPLLLELEEKKQNIIGLRIINQQPEPRQETERQATALLRVAKHQILEYLAGKRQGFDLPLAFTGTAFQESVWAMLQKIPYGCTESYQGIAKQIQNERACQAVGGANSKNPLPLLIPCHRVLNSKGTLQGYSFGGIETQQFLLDLETKNKHHHG